MRRHSWPPRSSPRRPSPAITICSRIIPLIQDNSAHRWPCAPRRSATSAWSTVNPSFSRSRARPRHCPWLTCSLVEGHVIPSNMANSGQVEWRPPAGVSLSVKALLLACLPWLAYQGYNHGLYHLISTNPAAQFTYFGIAVLYFAGSSPSRKECILAVAGGLALLILCPLDRPADFPGEALVRAGAFVGIAGLFAMCARAIVSRDRDSALDTLARSLIFVVLGIALGTMLGAASSARPYKYDHFLYAVDLRFGAAISFIAGRWMRASAAYGQLELVVYHSLPMAFAVLYAAHIRRAKQGPVDILNMMALNAVVGYGLYFLYPAAGPMYAFGSSFPFAAPHQGQFALQMVNL